MRLVVLAIVALVAVCARPGFAAQADTAARIEAVVRERAAAGTFSGVVLIAEHGRPIVRIAVGLADRQWKVPMTPDTVFRIGSTTKQLTAAAILQLAEQGKLSLDDPISRYCDAPSAWADVTLRMLLDHTSGIHDYTRINGFIRTSGRLDLKPEEFVALVRDMPMDFAPGSQFRYDNTGYALLGLVIEKVSGQPYDQYLADKLLRPLSMDHTAYDRSDEIVAKRASGYWLVDGFWRNARIMTTASTYASGGLRATADDLLAWDQALHAGKVVNRQSLEAMFSDRGHGYGFGAFVETRNGHRLWDHGGNVAGFSTAFERYPDDGLTVIVLSNMEGNVAEPLAKELAGIYFGWPP
jgi:CubicO group peptidase (beta-lactamase class C family)